MKLLKSLGILLLLSSPLLAQGEKVITISDFSGGLNSNYSSLTLEDDEVQDSLNVWFDEDNAVVKRKGFSTYATTGTLKFTNGWSYTDSSNNNWIVILSSVDIRASSGDGVFDIKIATVPPGSITLVGAVNAFGNIYFVDNVQGVYYWNSSSTTYVSGSPKGEYITEFKGRIWVAGEAHPNQNRLNGSKYLDAATWTTGTLATDPAQYIIGLTDKSDGITGLFVGINDVIYIFKKNSIHALYGSDQDDFETRILSNESGCIDAGTIQPFLGGILYLSKRGFDLFDGVTPRLLSKKINNKLEAALLSSFSQRSWVQTTKSDWDAGTISSTESLSTSITEGSIMVSTQVSQSFTDTSSANFVAGTLTRVSSHVVDGSLVLNQLNSGTTPYSCTSGTTQDSAACACYHSQSFQTTSSFNFTSLTVRLSRTNSPSAITVALKADSSGSPGTTIATLGTIQMAEVTTDSAGENETITFTTQTISAGTRYWITLSGTGCTVNAPGICTSGTTNLWYAYYTGTPCNSTSEKYDDSVTTREMNFSISGYQYASSGTIVSRTFDIGFTTHNFLWSWNTFTANSSVPVGSSITYQTQTSADGTTWNTPISIASGGTIGSSVQRYVRYVSSFTSNQLVQPRLDDVTINTTLFRKSTGTHISQIFNIGADITSFGQFEVGQDLTTGGAIEFRLCTSTDSAMNPKACTNQTADAQILTTINSYVQVYSSFTITLATQNPTLNYFIVKWNEGARRPRMSSAIYKDRYWISLTTNSNSLQNDSTFVLSKGVDNNKLSWTAFTHHAGSFILYKDQLYHADADATGKVYADDQGYNDADAAIHAYFKTKDYALDGILFDKIYDKLWLLADPLGNYTISTSYFLDRTSTEFALSDITTNEQSGLINLKLPFQLDSSHQVFGKIIALKFSNNEVNAPMKIYGLNLSYRSRKLE